MSTLPQIELADATGEVADLLTKMRKSRGSIPNMVKAMANSPALLKGYLALSDALASGVLSRPVRERIALASAEYNGCTYCLSAHNLLAKNVGKLDADEIERARHAQSADPHAGALLAVFDEIARNRGSIDEASVKTARAAGVTDAEIAEVVGNVALNVLSNYFNLVADPDLEFPEVRPHEHS